MWFALPDPGVGTLKFCAVSPEHPVQRKTDRFDVTVPKSTIGITTGSDSSPPCPTVKSLNRTSAPPLFVQIMSPVPFPFAGRLAPGV